MLQPSPAAVQLKEKMKETGHTTQSLSDATGIPYGTLPSWLHGRTKLDPLKLAHRDALTKIKDVSGIEIDSVASVAERPPTYGVPPAGSRLLEIMLSTIENPQIPKQQREDAKNIIREWLKDVV